MNYIEKKIKLSYPYRSKKDHEKAKIIMDVFSKHISVYLKGYRYEFRNLMKLSLPELKEVFSKK